MVLVVIAGLAVEGKLFGASFTDGNTVEAAWPPKDTLAVATAADKICVFSSEGKVL